MHISLKILVAVPMLFFTSVGIRWAVDPSGTAEMLGMPLLSGLGLSTQIGDLGSFFLSVGLMSLIGLISQQAAWFYSAAMLLLIAAFYRVIAWAMYGAVFATEQLAVEVIVSTLFIVAALRSNPASKN